jgi:hypothetical protein
MQAPTGMSERQFDEVVGPILEKQAAPWLLVEPGKGTYREATVDEIREGKFYKDHAEYQQAQATAI